jgi:hypothetical protein
LLLPITTYSPTHQNQKDNQEHNMPANTQGQWTNIGSNWPRAKTPYTNQRWATPKHYSLASAREYAQRLIPGGKLDHIPKKARDTQHWVDDRTYVDPKWGVLTWCDESPPRTKAQLMRAQVYVMDKLMGGNVDSLVKAVKRERSGRNGRPMIPANVTKWEEAKILQEDADRKRWMRTPAIPFWGDITEHTEREVYAAIAAKNATLNDFGAWMKKQRQGNGTSVSLTQTDLENLGRSMESLNVETGQTDIEIVAWQEWENEDSDTTPESASTQESEEVEQLIKLTA